MIEFTEGNILDAEAEALVNTVNTVGVMGKGIALMFKEAFPENFKDYVAACKRKELRVGRMFVTESDFLSDRSGSLIFRPKNIGAAIPKSNGLKRV